MRNEELQKRRMLVLEYESGKIQIHFDKYNELADNDLLIDFKELSRARIYAKSFTSESPFAVRQNEAFEESGNAIGLLKKLQKPYLGKTNSKPRSMPEPETEEIERPKVPDPEKKESENTAPKGKYRAVYDSNGGILNLYLLKKGHKINIWGEIIGRILSGKIVQGENDFAKVVQKELPEIKNDLRVHANGLEGKFFVAFGSKRNKSYVYLVKSSNEDLLKKLNPDYLL